MHNLTQGLCFDGLLRDPRVVSQNKPLFLHFGDTHPAPEPLRAAEAVEDEEDDHGSGFSNFWCQNIKCLQSVEICARDLTRSVSTSGHGLQHSMRYFQKRTADKETRFIYFLGA